LLDIFQAAIVAMEELEQERVKLYGKIVEENWKRSVIEVGQKCVFPP
jgi:hypothetical protein